MEILMNFIQIDEVVSILGISKSVAYTLHRNSKIQKILGEKLEFLENPLRFSKEQIDKLIPAYKKVNPPKIVSVSNHKGGVGKTTSTAYIGYVLAEKGYQVLLIDTDFQSNLSEFFVYDSEDNTVGFQSRNLFSFSEGLYNFNEIIFPTRIENLYIIPASEDLVAADDNSKIDEYFFKNALKDIKQFDYILFDTPPHISRLTIPALIASTDIIVPILASQFAVVGLTLLRKTISTAKIKNPTLNELGAFFSMYQERHAVSQLFNEAFKKYFKQLDTKIHVSTSVEQAHALHKTIFEYDPNNNVSIDYVTLCKEVFSV